MNWLYELTKEELIKLIMDYSDYLENMPIEDEIPYSITYFYKNMFKEEK